MNFEDVLLKHNKSVVKSRSECDTSIEFAGRNWVMPVIPANMKSIINSNICKQFTCNDWLSIYHRIDGVSDVLSHVYQFNNSRLYTAVSVGIKEEWIKLIEYIGGIYKIDCFTVDVALSFNDNILPVLECIKKRYPDAYVIIGNGSTAEWVTWCNELHSKNLIDAIKVGIGVSQSCRTRQYTGFGSTTLGSLIECKKEAADSLKIISDGGLTVKNGEVWIGDVAKALIFGADMVMTGAAFAGCKDKPDAGDYYGNASFASKGEMKHVEGESIKPMLHGRTIEEQMNLIQDSLRSSISYSGGRNIKEMKELARWEILK
jgi:GMP reductase